MNLTLIAAAVAGLIGFGSAWTVQDWRHDAAMLKRTQEEGKALVRKADNIDAAATNHEAFKAKTEVRYVTRTRTIEKLVDRPVYRNQCIDADGLRELNAAIAGRDDSGEPAPAVPGPAKP
ncbi:MAG: hypothetical protein EOO54_08400 [Haliea sp.]|nr:MAG: hypothetical protein EOO54_08400 [Haliea sp.]